MAQRKKNRTTPSAKTKTDNPTLPVEGAEQESVEQELRRDIFDEFLFHAANYIYVRRKLFITLAVVILVVLFSGYGTFRYIQYRETVRNEGLYSIEKVIYDNSLSESEQAEKAIPMLDEFVASYPETEQYNLALFYRAGLYYKTGDYEKAEQDFTKLLETLENGSDLYLLSSLSLANVLRDQDRTEEALEILSQAQTDQMADVFMMEEAEIYMRNDQNDKAKETLEILMRDFPQSAYSSKAKQLLDIL